MFDNNIWQDAAKSRREQLFEAALDPKEMIRRQREEAKKSDDGKRITECFKNNKMGKCCQLLKLNLNSVRNC
jgi:hypothetical protein